MTIQFAPGALVAFLLVLARASAWVVMAPPFNSRLVPAQVKVGFSAAIAVAVSPRLASQVNTMNMGTPELIGAMTIQVVVGMALGFMANLLMSAVQTAGSMIDLFGGFTIAQAYDPFSNAQSSMFSRVYQLLATTLLFAIDGHLLLVRGFMTSFDAIGATGLHLNNVSDLLIKNLGLFFVAAIEIAGPLLAALFLAEVVLGLLSRAAPQMNVFALGFPLKILITMLMAGIALPLLPDAVSHLVNDSLRAGTQLIH